MIKLTRAAIALTSFLSVCLAQPAINQDGILDGGGYTADVAQGSVFVVKGTGLSPAGFVQVSALPLTTTLNGVSISFAPADGRRASQAYMVYTYNLSGTNQLAAILPSEVPPGDYDVRVTNAGQQSAARRTRVVARKPGIVSASGSGSGPAQATTPSYQLIRFTTGQLGTFQLTPAKGGDFITLWMTGLGADAQSDPTGGTSGDVTATAQVRVLVGGVEVTPAYAGRSSGLPGTDQVNFQLPNTVAPSCYVPVQVRAGGALSNTVTIAVAAPGATACTHPTLSEAQLKRLSEGGSIVTGAFAVASIGTELSVPGLPITLPPQYAETIGGAFTRHTQDLVADASFSYTPGACNLWRRSGTITDLTLGPTPNPLDAGPQLVATLPSTTTVNLVKFAGSNVYNATLGATNNPSRTLLPGTYRLQGTGGTEVGAFSTSVNVPSFEWTNRAALTSVNRSQNLTVNWTGGSPGIVVATGFAGSIISGNLQTDPTSVILDAAGFVCIAQGSAATLTVPSSILQQLPAAEFNPLGSTTGIGSMSVYAVSDGTNGTFTAPLVPGGNIDYGVFTYSVGNSKLLTYQ